MIDGLVDRRDFVVMVAADEMPWRYLDHIRPCVPALCVRKRTSASQRASGRQTDQTGISPSSVIALNRLSAGSGNNTEASKPTE